LANAGFQIPVFYNIINIGILGKYGKDTLMLNIFAQYKGLNRSAYVLFFARLINAMGSFIWPMLTMIMSIKLGYKESEIALIFLIIAVLFLPGNIIGGKLADHFNKKLIIVSFNIISVIFFMICSFIEPGNLMLVFFVLAGLFVTMEGPSHEALAIESSLPKDREKIFSLTYLGNNIGFIVGASLGGFLISNYLSLAFIIDGSTTLIATFLVAMYVIPIKEEEITVEDRNIYEDEVHVKHSGFKLIWNRKSILIQILTIIFIGFIYDQWTFIIPLHMAEIFGENNGPINYGFVASVNGLVVILTTPILTYFTKRMVEMKKIVISMALYAVSFAIFFLSQGLPIFYIFIILFTLGEVMSTISMSPYFSRRIPITHRGRINSYRNITGMIGSIAGKVAMGFLVENFGFNTGYALVVFIAVAAGVITALNMILDRKIFPKLYQNLELQKEISS